MKAGGNPVMRNKKSTIFVVFLLLITFYNLYPTAVFAEETGSSVYDYLENKGDKESNIDETENGLNEEVNRVGITARDIVKTIFSLIFVVALLYLLLKWLKRKTSSLPESNLIQNLGGISVGPNKSIQMVKAGDSILIIGVGENIELLKEITDSNQVSEMMDFLTKKKAESASSAKFYTNLLEKWRHDKMDGEETTSFRARLDQELHKTVKKRKDTFQKELGKGNYDK